VSLTACNVRYLLFRTTCHHRDPTPPVSLTILKLVLILNYVPVFFQGAYLRSVVSGHIRYFGVPMNGPGISVFHKEVCQMWMKTLRRRSQKHRLNCEPMKRLIAKWLPPARVCHPYPVVRFGVIT